MTNNAFQWTLSDQWTNNGTFLAQRHLGKKTHTHFHQLLRFGYPMTCRLLWQKSTPNHHKFRYWVCQKYIRRSKSEKFHAIVSPTYKTRMQPEFMCSARVTVQNWVLPLWNTVMPSCRCAAIFVLIPHVLGYMHARKKPTGPLESNTVLQNTVRGRKKTFALLAPISTTFIFLKRPPDPKKIWLNRNQNEASPGHGLPSKILLTLGAGDLCLPYPWAFKIHPTFSQWHSGKDPCSLNLSFAEQYNVATLRSHMSLCNRNCWNLMKSMLGFNRPSKCCLKFLHV